MSSGGTLVSDTRTMPTPSASREFKLLQLRLHQIIPAVPHRLLEITVVWNPVWPTLRQHFDPALIDPVENAKLVRNAGVVGGVLAAESEVFDEGREIVLLLIFSTQSAAYS